MEVLLYKKNKHAILGNDKDVFLRIIIHKLHYYY